MRLSSGLADSRSTVHVVSNKDSEAKHRTDLDELVDVEYSPFTRLDNDLDILLAYKLLDSFWCQWTSSLPNPSRLMSIVTPSETQTYKIKVDQSSIANELSKLPGLYDVSLLLATALLVGANNAIEVASH